MNDERQMILQMLKEGKITVEEASQLLEAIGSKKNHGENDFVTKLTQSIDNVIKKTTETLGSIDFDNIDIAQYNIKGEVNTHKEMRIDDDINNINIDIQSGKVLIERASDSAITLIQDIWSKKADLNDYIDVEINEDTLNIIVDSKYYNLGATSILKLSLGKNIYDNLDLNVVNGNIEIADVDFTNSNVDSVNGKVVIINSAGNLEIDNINGKIDVKNTNGNLDIQNTNGTIYLSNVSGNEANLSTVSGSIRVDGLLSEKLDASSKSGNIRVYHIDKTTKDISLNSGFGTVVVDTEGYEGDVRAQVESQGLSMSDKFINKIQKDKGYEISTNTDREDLNISVKAGFGKVNFR